MIGLPQSLYAAYSPPPPPSSSEQRVKLRIVALVPGYASVSAQALEPAGKRARAAMAHQPYAVWRQFVMLVEDPGRTTLTKLRELLIPEHCRRLYRQPVTVSDVKDQDGFDLDPEWTVSDIMVLPDASQTLLTAICHLEFEEHSTLRAASASPPLVPSNYSLSVPSIVVRATDAPALTRVVSTPQLAPHAAPLAQLVLAKGDSVPETAATTQPERKNVPLPIKVEAADQGSKSSAKKRRTRRSNPQASPSPANPPTSSVQHQPSKGLSTNSAPPTPLPLHPPTSTVPPQVKGEVHKKNNEVKDEKTAAPNAALSSGTEGQSDDDDDAPTDTELPQTTLPAPIIALPPPPPTLPPQASKHTGHEKTKAATTSGSQNTKQPVIMHAGDEDDEASSESADDTQRATTTTSGPAPTNSGNQPGTGNANGSIIGSGAQKSGSNSKKQAFGGNLFRKPPPAPKNK